MTFREFQKAVRWARKNGVQSFTFEGNTCTFAARGEARPAIGDAARPPSNVPPEIDADFEQMLAGLDDNQRRRALQERMLLWSA